jgi:Uncharacterized protein involved in propionate catabolism
MTDHYSKACVDFTHTVTIKDIPETVQAHLRLCILDWLGCVIGGTGSPLSAPAKDLVAAMQGAEQASILCGARKTTIRDAAFFNGYVGHILEMDDVDKESITHPATVIIPAALAVGEWLGKSGGQILEAIYAGYEVMLRIGAAITPEHYAIWHTTATSGVFGAAMAAGKLLDLNREQLLWAFGNAGTMSAGLWQFNQNGAMSKFLHTGSAASNGVLAAYLASRGFTGAQKILEGSQGFFAGYARQEVSPSIFSDFGVRHRSGGVSIKPYPCCRHTHSTIDAAATLRTKKDPEKIRAVLVNAYDVALNIAGNPAPTTPREAKFSLAYCVTRTLLYGPLTQKDFTGEAVAETMGHDLIRKVRVVESAELSAMMPQLWPSLVEVEYDDGSREQEMVSHPKGDPENPVTWDETVRKFRGMTEEILDEQGQRKVVDFCASLQKQAAPGQLFTDIRAGLLPAGA